jgi:hypothetical protein
LRNVKAPEWTARIVARRRFLVHTWHTFGQLIEIAEPRSQEKMTPVAFVGVDTRRVTQLLVQMIGAGGPFKEGKCRPR